MPATASMNSSIPGSPTWFEVDSKPCSVAPSQRSSIPMVTSSPLFTVAAVNRCELAASKSSARWPKSALSTKRGLVRMGRLHEVAGCGQRLAVRDRRQPEPTRVELRGGVILPRGLVLEADFEEQRPELADAALVDADRRGAAPACRASISLLAAAKFARRSDL